MESPTASRAALLSIVVPAFNEAESLPLLIDEVRAAAPALAGVADAFELVIVDDGSTDRTAEVARGRGARVVRLPENRGLANAFRLGLDEAVRLGADAIVNTDGDHQYRGADVPRYW